jgi:transcriptional regulator with XRE-family HTH domain
VIASAVNLDRLAGEIAAKMREGTLSLRDAALEVGCSPATLSRFLKGASAESIPDTKSLFRVLSWLGMSLSEFESGRTPTGSTLTEVELHLRALPGITGKDKDALVAMVRAAHDSFKVRAKKS